MLVYKLTNKISGKSYIGQTTQSIHLRIKRHCTSEGCPLIYRAICKYGIENFTIEILEEDVVSLEELNKKEIQYIEVYKTLHPYGYNLQSGGLNYKMSQETRDKLSKINTGKKLSQEHKNKIGNSLKGRKMSASSVNKRIKSMEGYKHSEETKNKIGHKNKGRKSAYGAAKLQPKDILFIRHWLNKGYTITDVAKVFGRGRSTIEAIKYGKSWTHV